MVSAAEWFLFGGVPFLCARDLSCVECGVYSSMLPFSIVEAVASLLFGVLFLRVRYLA